MKNEYKGSEYMTENNIENGDIYGRDYKFWISDEVRPYIFEFLRKEFPDKFVIHEFDQVDIFILDENLPVEIQSVHRQTKGKDRLKGPRISGFEDDIRRQIDTNISTYGRCWFFFDESLLGYLQNDMGRHNSINMDWLYQYFKEGKIRIFTITNNGIIKEMHDEDFSFLPKVSNTCKRGENEDFRILQKNRAKVTLNVLKGHGFTMDETNNIYITFKSRKETDIKSLKPWLMRKEQERTYRQLEYGYIRDIRLEHINNVLSCTIFSNSGSGQSRNTRSLLYMLLTSGLFDRDKNGRIYFVDKYNISQYFPGYVKKKDLWDYLRTHGVDERTFNAIIRGETDYLWWIKSQTTIEDAWNS
jgi:hypothetical protein